jgi:hypothetical protein
VTSPGTLGVAVTVTDTWTVIQPPQPGADAPAARRGQGLGADYEVDGAGWAATKGRDGPVCGGSLVEASRWSSRNVGREMSASGAAGVL